MAKEFLKAYITRAKELGFPEEKIALANLVSENENGKIFKCSGSDRHYLNLIRALKIEGIPFIQTLNKGIIIKNDDIDRVRALNAQAYRMDASYVTSTTMDKMKDAVKKRNMNEKIMTIEGMNEDFCYYLAGRCGGISPGYVVAINNEGTNFAVRENCVYSEDSRTGEDFCKAYLAAQIQYYGGNTAWVREKMNENNNAYVAVEHALETDENCYIISSIDASAYMEIDKDGYSLIGISENGTETGKKVDITDKDFYQKLAEDITAMKEKEIYADKEEMLKKIEENREILPERKRTYHTDMRIAADVWMKNERLADKLDTIIRKKMDREGKASGIEYFNRYKKNAEVIFKALAMDMQPNGYEAGDFEDIRKMEQERKVELGYIKNINKHSMEVHIQEEQMAALEIGK